MADSSQFDVFGLQDSIAAQDLSQAIHRLERLLDNDVELNILNWMLQREVQIISQLYLNARMDWTAKPYLNNLRYGAHSSLPTQHALARHSDNSIKQMIALAERIERAIKRGPRRTGRCSALSSRCVIVIAPTTSVHHPTIRCI